MERADLRTTAHTKIDNRYEGVARHPKARAWLIRRFVEAHDRGDYREAERRRQECQELGVRF